MNVHAFYHLTGRNYVYAYDKNTLHIRMRTAKDDATSVTVHAGDPYEWDHGGGGGNLNAEGANGWVHEKIPMVKEASCHLFDYWLAKVTPPFKRLRYSFIIENEQEKYFYGETGVYNFKDEGTKKIAAELKNFFCFPFLNEADVFSPPQWAKNTVWYQIFPERFANGNPTNNPKGTKPWDSVNPTYDSFFGGDIQGIMNRLSYLADLGITGIYLCPIFKSPSTHKYDTEDYFEIDPQFGTKALFKQFVRKAHDYGIKIMLDMVVNHCGYQFKPWEDVVKNGENSLYKEWFHIHEFPVTSLSANTRPNYDAFAFVKGMPKMNTNHPQVRDYFLDVARYWTREYDIDGWRLDVANEVDHLFWRKFREAVHEVKKDVYILGEVWHDANPWLGGDQFDAVMNYPLTGAIVDFFGKDFTTASQFKNELAKISVMYPQSVKEVNFNLLGSHDTARLLTVCGENKKKAMLAYAFLMTQAGAPCIYYGDEIGISGGHDPLCRKCMVWDELKQDLHMRSFFKKLVFLRKNHAALRSVQLDWLQTDDTKGMLVFKKCDAQEELLIVINNGKKNFFFDGGEAYRDLLTDETFVAKKPLAVLAQSLRILSKD